MDFIQICIVDVFVGGLLLFVLAILPFELFTWPVLVTSILLCSVLTIAIHAKSLINWLHMPKKDFINSKKKNIIIYALVLLMFLSLLSINLYSLSDFVFGSVRDESVHALYVQVLLENHFIPLTLQPYLPEGIIYPQASHAIFAFAFDMLSLEVPQIILYVSALFKSLTVLGGYFLGKKLCKRKEYALGLAFIFTFISAWPLNVTWGANPFIVGFPLYLVCLGLLFDLFQKRSIIEVFIVGLLFGYAGSIILSYFEILLATTLVLFIICLFKEHSRRIRVVGRFGLILAASLIPISPFLYRFIYFWPYPNHNIGIPQDVINLGTAQLQNILPNISLDVILNVISSNIALGILTISFIIISFILISKKDFCNNNKIIIIGRYALVIFLTGLLLILISCFLTPGLDVISWVHQNILLSVPINLIILVFFVVFTKYVGKNVTLPKITFRRDFNGAFLLAILILTLLVSPFVYARLTINIDYVESGYAAYGVTTESDLELMQWMKTNLAFSDTVILVHPFGSGTFIPSVSHLRVVYPFTGSWHSKAYNDLVYLIENKTINSKAYTLMHDLNISYIFINSAVAKTGESLELGFSTWTPETLLGNPNFKLVKNYNDSYLFKVDVINQDVAFYDNFEYANWSRNLWQFNFTGNGLGNATINPNGGLNGSSGLQITSQAIPKTGEFEAQYAYWVNRTIFAPNNMNTTFSFYVNATNGFNGQDTFAILLSDSNFSKTLVIATPNSIYQNYSTAITLGSYNGTFSYNLSELWEQAYDSPLPQIIVLTLESIDFDGVQNVVNIDDITVQSFLD